MGMRLVWPNTCKTKVLDRLKLWPDDGARWKVNGPNSCWDEDVSLKSTYVNFMLVLDEKWEDHKSLQGSYSEDHEWPIRRKVEQEGFKGIWMSI